MPLADREKLFLHRRRLDMNQGDYVREVHGRECPKTYRYIELGHSPVPRGYRVPSINESSVTNQERFVLLRRRQRLQVRQLAELVFRQMHEHGDKNRRSVQDQVSMEENGRAHPHLLLAYWQGEAI